MSKEATEYMQILKKDFELFQQNTKKIKQINDNFNIQILRLKDFYKMEKNK